MRPRNLVRSPPYGHISALHLALRMGIIGFGGFRFNVRKVNDSGRRRRKWPLWLLRFAAPPYVVRKLFDVSP